MGVHNREDATRGTHNEINLASAPNVEKSVRMNTKLLV